MVNVVVFNKGKYKVKELIFKLKSEINKIIRRHYNLDDKVYLSNLFDMKRNLENLIEQLDTIILLIRV